MNNSKTTNRNNPANQVVSENDIEQKYNKQREITLREQKKLRTIKYELEKTILKPKLESVIGQCYKVRNNYSCPEKQSDYWWLYARIIKYNGTNVYYQTFQTDKYKIVTFEILCISTHTIFDRYTKISQSEYNRALSRALSLIQNNYKQE